MTSKAYPILGAMAALLLAGVTARASTFDVRDYGAVVNNPEQIAAEKDGRNAYQSRIDFSGKTFLVRVIVADAETPAIVVTA